MAWRTLLTLGVVSIAAAGCTSSVTVTNDGGLETGGTTSTGGGAGTGGSGTGGAQGGTGGQATGGTVSTGGVGTGGIQDDGSVACTPGTTPTDCTTCLTTFCCQEYNDCKDARCAGTASTDGELQCMITCFNNGFAMGGPLDGGAVTLSDCSDMCKGSNAVLAQSTQRIVSCIVAKGDAASDQQCGQLCFHGQPN